MTYGRFFLPWLMVEPVVIEGFEDSPVDQKRQEAAAQLAEWIHTDERQTLALVTFVGTESPSLEQDVRGTVLAVSWDRTLVMIDMGSDSGISEGLELAVHRGGPVPFTLGNVTVAKVWTDRAVACLSSPCLPIRLGDEVRAAARWTYSSMLRRQQQRLDKEYEAAMKALKRAMPELDLEINREPSARLSIRVIPGGQ
jgi:hypothetical protein